ncbi:MAG: acetate/propionate family kinase [Solitalea-like symbiont of Tyrophagus putrescentiae]
MYVLVINSGSSSIKYQLVDMPAQHILASGLVERISLDNSIMTHKVFKDGMTHQYREEKYIESHHKGLEAIYDLLINYEHPVIKNSHDISVVGHRIVHGGDTFVKTTLITPEVKSKVKELINLAPLHNPANLLGIEVSEQLFENAKQIAVFDTAFHQSIPEHAYRYALPEHLYTENKVRVYGFHGISHQYVSKKATEYLGLSTSKFITMHLGNGCSAAAIKDGKSIDTSMGMGPLGGLIMGTRPGDIDPSALMYILSLGYSTNEVSDMLNKNSGMKAISGFSDMREVEDLYNKGDERGKLAYSMAAYRLKKYIGAYYAIMNGLDAIIFTGGIGENDPLMRKLVCDNLNHFGILIDKDKNKIGSKNIQNISLEASEVDILVIPTNEELEIAIQSYECLITQ